MNQSSKETQENEQNPEKKKQHKKKDQDQEKEKLKSDVSKLKETLSKTDSLRERAENAEAKISSLEQSNTALSQQINTLTLQNSQLLNELALLRNQKITNLNEDISQNKFAPIYMQPNIPPHETSKINNDIQQLQKTIYRMQEKHLEELAFRDDLIERLRANINFNAEYDQTEMNEAKKRNQKLKQQLKQQENVKQMLSKKKKNLKKNIVISEDIEDSYHSPKVPNSPTDHQILEQKYLKKKNKLTLIRQQYEELEEESRIKIKKTKENLDEVREKFQLLKKKYVDLKEDFSSLQLCYQAVVQKAEALSAELQKTSSPSKSHHAVNDFPPITIEKHSSHTKMVKHHDDKNSKEKTKYHEMKKRAERAEEDVSQLRCLIKILASNEKNFDKLNLHNQNIIGQLDALGIKIDRLEHEKEQHKISLSTQNRNMNDYQGKYSNQKKRTVEYPESYSTQKNRIESYTESYSIQKKKKKNRSSSNSPQRKKSSDFQDSDSPHRRSGYEYHDSFSSPKKRSSSAKKETRKLPQWRQFQDF
ncbi:hypothetical protein M9Y10_009583 [Tritrichomonas musculus]|uniref:Uncharacterized protein n=1 Tax=Tritrichomonas musculus TaxID=1915356 RepID=A0ABR2INZ9_9EUKA